MKIQLPIPLFLLFSLGACSSPGSGTGAAGVRNASAEIETTADILGTLAAPDSAPTSWKERLSQGYVYLEETGDYRDLGDAMRRLLNLVEVTGTEPTGAPFSLFYDDPSVVPVQELRARVCCPVAERPTGAPDSLAYDTLPRAMILYTRVRGAYSDVPMVYPTLFRSLAERGWTAKAPIREIYLVNPAEAKTYDDLITEVQIPWSLGG